MNPIPTWVRRLWDVWDLRVLVLLSFTLQLILSIFGNRRKYKSSLWINVLVWSAYLMADWVATVALGKLSDVQGDPEKSNVLWVIWAPLLLLHLGGPDTITAYSLEDNQLWLRHLLGLVVQLFVATYVILMSWKNSWFSFMSLLALVAGIIKYGERTWVLKSVSGNNLKDTIPFGNLRDKYAAMRHEYARVLILAHFQLKEFMMYLGGEGDSESYPQVIEHNMDLEAVEGKMNPIPAWVRRLWNVWDLRVLVLLSFTLQLILSIFGSRRKYISSLWISVLVWSAYLIADWVATVALGKLSDAQGNDEKINVLWAVWAPLLLLHLGGPDTITAYSLEDNHLWMRHLLGLVVQFFVAIYVLLLSWENSWFSFMSLPALVAGIIKYGERTWVLKLVSAGNYIDIIPFGDLEDCYRIGAPEYVRVLILAHCHLRTFMIYLGGQQREPWYYPGGSPHLKRVSEDNIGCDAVEVSMGLMYDLLYTKATKIFSKGGLILRCISFGCTVTVSVGLIFRIVLLKTTSEEDEIDMAITGVLILGALAMEIYAAIVIFSSNWFMLWLIKQHRVEWVIWLNERFPWLFNKEKSWSKMMWQFDLLGYCLKDWERNVLSRRLIRSVLGRDYDLQWNGYRHTTAYPVHPSVYNALSDYYKAQSSSTNSDDLRARDHELAKFRAILEDNPPISFRGKFFGLHVATEICYHLENEWDDAGGGDHQDNPSAGSDSSSSSSKEVCKVVSDYIMYLLVMHPSLLPDDGSRGAVEMVLLHNHDHVSMFVGWARDRKQACRGLLEAGAATAVWSRIVAEGLKGMGKVKRWETLKQMWLDLVRDASVSSPTGKSGHFQQLRQGGEFLTLMWFLSLHPRNLPPWRQGRSQIFHYAIPAGP